MAKLTIQERVIIQKNDEISLEDGYDLVIKQDEKFTHYPEGQLPKKSGVLDRIFNKKNSREVFAVSMDDRHEIVFKKSVAHSDGIHQFFVDINLQFGVNDPLDIVKQFRRDPVEKLKEEAGKQIVGFLKIARWDDIKDSQRFQKLKSTALETMVISGRDEVVPMFDHINSHGVHYGLKLGKIDFDVVISEKDLKVEISLDEDEKSKLISDSNTHRDLHVDANEQQVIAQKNHFKRSEEIKDQLAQTTKIFIDRTGSNIAEGSRSIHDVHEVINRTRQIQEEFNSGNKLEAGSTSSSSSLLGTGSNAMTSLQDIIIQLKNADVGSETEKQILGSLFHMAGGKLLKEEDERIQEYLSNLDGLSISVDLQEYFKSKWSEFKKRVDDNKIF